MHSSFTTDPRVTVLFKQFTIETKFGIGMSCGVFVLLGILYEGLKCLKLNVAERSGWKHKRKTCFTKAHALQTIIYISEFLFGYALMLAVMTFNAWLFVAVVVGSTIGLQLCVILRGSHIAGGVDRHPADAPESSSNEKITCKGSQGDGSEGGQGEKQSMLSQPEIVELTSSI